MAIGHTRAALGTLHSTEDGRYALRFERRLAHPPEKVWRAITDWEQLRAWFPATVQFDLRPGARIRFRPSEEQKRRLGFTDEHNTTDGEIIRVEPPTLLEYTWADETLLWELSPDGDGCLLVFTNILGDRDAAAPVAAGWHAGLEVLQSRLDGQDVEWAAWDRAGELTADYAESFG